jgi:hypothetical protein
MTSARKLRCAVLTALSLASISAAAAAPKPMDGDIAHTLIGKLRSTKMTPVDAPGGLASGDFAHGGAEHINGMARVGRNWIVNYTDTDGKGGRLLIWPGAGSYKVYRVTGLTGAQFMAGMGGDNNLLALATASTSIRFFEFTEGLPVKVHNNFKPGSTSYREVGLAYDTDKGHYVLLLGGTIYLGRPTTSWTKVGKLSDAFVDSSNGSAAEESRPLIYLGNGVFAAFVLKPGDDEYEFDYTVFSFDKGGKGAYTITTLGTDVTRIELSDKGSAANVAHDFGNNQGFQPSFRWAGNVTFKGTLLQMCAAPRQLDFSGNYSCWSVDATPLLTPK